MTARDLDARASDPAYLEPPTPGPRFYLVADVGRAGELGPLGHYGR